MRDDPRIPITTNQPQLLSSALRLRILNVLASEPKTAKEIADAMGKTRGNVHYHIQRLLDGGIVELVKTRPVGAIIEKYYRARSTHFPLQSDGPKSGRLATKTWLTLSREEAEALRQQVTAVLNAGEQRMPADRTARGDYHVAFNLLPEAAAREEIS